MSLLIEVVLLSSALAFLLVLLSKFLTKQTEIKKTKKEMEEYGQKIKQAQKDKDEQAVKQYTDKRLKLSYGQMKYSTRSMMVSMLVVVVAFGWLGAQYGQLSVTIDHGEGGEKADMVGYLAEGKQKLVVYSAGSLIGFDSDKDGVIADSEKYSKAELVPYNGGYLKFGEPSANKITAELIVAKAPFNAPFAGPNLTWFWLYIFITIPTTLIVRKLLDVQ